MGRERQKYWKGIEFWTAISQMVVAVAVVVALGLSLWQLRMAYREASEQRTESHHKRTRDERMLQAMTLPYLALDRQYRGIEVEVGDGGKVGRSRRKHPDDPVSTLVVKNFGTGPALNCRVEFRTLQANFTSIGRDLIRKPETTTAQIDPRNIMPGQEARLLGWPSCFDGTRNVAVHDAQGYIVFTCELLDGTIQEFKETFDIWNGLGAKPYPLLKMNAWGKEFPWDKESQAAER